MAHNQSGKIIHIAVQKGELEGELIIPKNAKGLVLFAHGSGSSRFSPRNQFVAHHLQKYGLATFLIDLLTSQEEKIDEYSREFRFDINLLAERLLIVTKWLREQKDSELLKIGYFGSSTGAAAALIAAAKPNQDISAIVSRGGRPDLAISFLSLVKAPTLLIVGGEDHTVIDLNELAFQKLMCSKKMEIVPGATHLFEEPGTLEEVAQLAAEWFQKYLT